MANHMTSGRGKSWHNHITIDLLARVLSNSIFHPFIASLIPLCLRSRHAPYESTEFLTSCAYAGLVTLFWLLSILNKRVAYGAPRPINWDAEVVVITGGANGLGKVLAQMYGMRGASVVVLDVAAPENESEGLAGVKFYHCDVGNADAVGQAAAAITHDVGAPTILINNAGIVNGKAMWELTEQDVQRNMNVNLISHFNTIRTFLPGMLASETGGTIVTVASVLGKLGASHLSDYCAAKAGLIAMHTSLRADLSAASAPEGAKDIRTVLVTPGQLSTRLFAELETPSNFFGPIVETVELAKAIVQKIDDGESGEISLPFYTRWIEWNTVLPASIQNLIRIVSGIDRAMGQANTRAAKRR